MSNMRTTFHMSSPADPYFRHKIKMKLIYLRGHRIVFIDFRKLKITALGRTPVA
jgi:hypothetical protein